VLGDDAPRACRDAAGDRVALTIELHAVALRLPEIVVARPLAADLVQQLVGDDRGPPVLNGVDVVRPDVAGAGQLQTAGLVVLLPAHHVVADGERLRRREAEGAACVSLVLARRCRDDRARRFGRRHGDLASLAALLVAAEEEQAIAYDRTAEVPAELLLIEGHL